MGFFDWFKKKEAPQDQMPPASPTGADISDTAPEAPVETEAAPEAPATPEAPETGDDSGSDSSAE